MKDQRIKDLMKIFKQREQELLRQNKKRHEEIRRNTQKKRIEIINEAEKRKQELLRYNIDFQRKQEEKMRELQRREKINNISHNIRLNGLRINNNDRQRSIMNERIIANIIRAQQLRPNNMERNVINIEFTDNNNNNNRNNSENTKIEELLQDFKLTDEILGKMENKQCLICLDDYAINENVCYLPCFHLFHSICIKSWIKKSNKCPLCKNIIKLE